MSVWDWLTGNSDGDFDQAVSDVKDCKRYLTSQSSLIQTALQTGDEDDVSTDGVDHAFRIIRKNRSSRRLAALFDASTGFSERDYKSFQQTLGKAQSFLHEESNETDRREELKVAQSFIEELVTKLDGVLQANHVKQDE